MNQQAERPDAPAVIIDIVDELHLALAYSSAAELVFHNSTFSTQNPRHKAALSELLTETTDRLRALHRRLNADLSERRAKRACPP